MIKQVLFRKHSNNISFTKTSMMQKSECTDENIFLTTTAKNTLKVLPVGESNTGLPRDRRGYLPLY